MKLFSSNYVPIPFNLLDYVSDFKGRLYNACKLTQENLKSFQAKMKVWYDKEMPRTEFLNQVRKFLYICQFLSKLKESLVNYVVKTHGRRRENQVCYINMLKMRSKWCKIGFHFSMSCQDISKLYWKWR